MLIILNFELKIKLSIFFKVQAHLLIHHESPEEAIRHIQAIFQL